MDHKGTATVGKRGRESHRRLLSPRTGWLLAEAAPAGDPVALVSCLPTTWILTVATVTFKHREPQQFFFL